MNSRATETVMVKEENQGSGKGPKRKGGDSREKERETPRAMGTGMALSSLAGPLGGSVRNGPSTMPTHHGHTIMTIATECSGRPWSP